jgi:hypothetical protein
LSLKSLRVGGGNSGKLDLLLLYQVLGLKARRLTSSVMVIMTFWLCLGWLIASVIESFMPRISSLAYPVLLFFVGCTISIMPGVPKIPRQWF